MFKRIVVALCDNEHCLPVIRQAIVVAGRERAQVLGLYVIHQEELLPPPDTVTREMWHAEVEPDLRAIGQSVLDVLTAECAKADVPVETRLLIGEPAKAASRAGYTADLIVLGRYGEYARRGGVLGGHVLEGVLRQATRPVLIAANQARPIERILVAYDGSAAGSVALSVTARLATEWRATVVMATVAEKRVGQGALTEGTAYLQPYGLPEKTLLLEGTAGEELVRAAAEESADLIVMGGYCHGRGREFITGGTLGQVVRKSDLPVLVSC